jgi:hypothetical protein
MVCRISNKEVNVKKEVNYIAEPSQTSRSQCLLGISLLQRIEYVEEDSERERERGHRNDNRMRR